jgi:hypothetical protein
MPVKQTRFAGPMYISGVSQEEIRWLRGLVSRLDTKITFVIFGTTTEGFLKLCARSQEKFSATMWTRLLGISMIQQKDIIPPSVVSGSVSHKDAFHNGILECRRIKGFEEFSSNKKTGSTENARVQTGMDGPDKEMERVASTMTTTSQQTGDDSQDNESNEADNNDGDKPVDETSEGASLSNKKRKLPYWVYPHLDDDPAWEEKVRRLVTIRMHLTRTANNGAKTPLNQLSPEEVWSELYAESLVWCEEQKPLVVQPGVHHKEYVAQGMITHPLANEEWRKFAKFIASSWLGI